MGNLWQIAVVVVLAAVLLPAVNIAYTEQTTASTTNETLTVQYGETTNVSVDAATYGPNTTVTYDGTELTDGDDYEWRATSGSVYWPTDSTAPDGATVDIEYTYHEADEHTGAAATIMGSVGQFAWILVFITILATLMTWLGLGRGGGW